MCYMKYFTLLFVSLSCLTLAYTQTDLSRANMLAGKGIIVDRSTEPDRYHLDNQMARQELLGTALKASGITLPSDYTCRGYFTDAYFPANSTDAWVCRTFEIAADNGLVTRANERTRPRDFITRAEALAIVVQSLSVSQDFSQYTNNFMASAGYADWQTRLLMSVDCRIFNHGQSCSTQTDHENVVRNFRANQNITRAEAFEFFDYALSWSTINSERCDAAAISLLESGTIDEAILALDIMADTCTQS